MDLVEVFATYDSALYERFRGLGVDFTSGHALAHALGYHTSNKPRPKLPSLPPGEAEEILICVPESAGEGECA